MTIVADLDAAIEQHNAEISNDVQEIKIFGRVWPMINDLMTDVVQPLARILEIASVALDPNSDKEIDPVISIQAIAAVPEVLPLVIREEFTDENGNTWRPREAFTAALKKNGGLPVALTMDVITAVFTAYDALPFHSATPTPENVTNTPQPALPTTPGTTSGHTGSLSNQNSNPSQPVMPMPPIAAVPVQEPQVSSG